jgi:GTP-dependent phosphoenolpyruvate carboxykinase
LLAVNPSLWQAELAAIGEYLAEYADRVPQALKTELAGALDRVRAQ